ncbi:glycosyltransferase family 39 protein [Herpetosiphon giganteus]|uniref:glycosyltransferase family 39 protein n=1 Tax=Herpetosiphon giganteus TaxID=2029754 RepID=UPI001959E77A|nr:glycosyltransferase family 39 protein [Herpetosiphon giganteus]MBM7845911.1 tetratricopeptide (TPR) repeat protein [Herpetosiphon giganteus]
MDKRFRWWPTTSRYRLILILLLVGAAAVRLALWLLPSHQPANDEVEYLAVARDLLAGNGWRFYDSYPWLRAPLYPLYLAATLWLSNNDPQIALLFNLGLSVLHVWLLWLLGREWAGDQAHAEKVGLWTAGLASGLLTFATFANLWMSETLWNVLWASSLLLILRWQRSKQLRFALFAGLTIGLTILTRSLPLAFLPVLIGWMWWNWRGWRSVQHGLALGLVACAVIAPWSLRNWLAYGRLITVETGFAYNLWAFSEPPLELSEINTILAAIPNPAERADYASARGRELLAANPSILARKPWTNTVYLWRIKPIEDRFLQANYYSDVALPYLLVALIFDDFWYIACVILALWGFARAPRDDRWWLGLLWVGYIVGSTMFTHGEARYRQFFWPIMLIYAAFCLAKLRMNTPLWQRLAATALGLIIGCVIIDHSPWQLLQQQVQRGWWDWRADQALAAGNLPQAEAASLKALSILPSADSWLAFAEIKAQFGQPDAALEAYLAATNHNHDYPLAHYRLGQYLLEQGDQTAASEAWANQYVDSSSLLATAWQAADRPAEHWIDVGAGLDIGLIDGFYPAESLADSSARWSLAKAKLRLPAGKATMLRLRLSNPRPVEAPAAKLQICVAAAQCVQVAELEADWRVLQIPLAASEHERHIEILAQPWQPASDQRQLGIVLDWVEVVR